MSDNNELCLNNTRLISKAFIERCYPDEVPHFDIVWDTMSPNLKMLLSKPGEIELRSADNLTAVSFASSSALDMVTPILLATVSDTMNNLSANNISASDLKDHVASAAARFGAKPSLTAALAQHIPNLCKELFNIDTDADEAILSASTEKQYRYWTNGKDYAANSISEYEERKDSYFFWLDIDRPTHVSETGYKITKAAINILRLLTDRIGTVVSSSELLGNDLDEDDTWSESHIAKFEQQLTKLHKFSGDQFRNYLFGNIRKNGRGLEESFADKYFLYRRIR